MGSQLYLYLKQTDLGVETVDLEVRGNFVNPQNQKKDFSLLSAEALERFDVIVLLAAHSSVFSAVADPRGALLNNLVHFYDLLKKLKRRQKIIYASSSSVYSGSGSGLADESWNHFSAHNVYDLTKYAADVLAPMAAISSYFGLRFGTICGVSPNMRHELVLNAMCRSAVQEKSIMVRNPQIHRPVLGIGDACRAIERLIHLSGKHSTFSGIYNLASFTGTINKFAVSLASQTKSTIIYQPDTPTYDFSINSQKFEAAFDFEFKDSLESLTGELRNYYLTDYKKPKTFLKIPETPKAPEGPGPFNDDLKRPQL